MNRKLTCTVEANLDDFQQELWQMFQFAVKNTQTHYVKNTCEHFIRGMHVNIKWNEKYLHGQPVNKQLHRGKLRIREMLKKIGVQETEKEITAQLPSRVRRFMNEDTTYYAGPISLRKLISSDFDIWRLGRVGWRSIHETRLILGTYGLKLNMSKEEISDILGD